MKFLAPALCASLLAASPAYAWNARGHMTVAAVAWSQMTPTAQAHASALVKLNPRYAAWISGASAADRDEVAFVKAATWPDELRSFACSATHPSPCYQDDGYTPADAGTDLNIGYTDMRLRKYWHFAGLAFSMDGTPVEAPFAFNAQTQIIAFEAALSDAALSDGAKSYDLVWLLHLVGDVHQPLHAMSRFSADSPHGDSGGNGVSVCLAGATSCTAQSAKALHSFWDGAIGANPDPFSAIAKARALPQVLFSPDVLDAAPESWVAESFELARLVAYADPIGPGKGPYQLTAAYQTAAVNAAEQRIILAGTRLARVLNARL